MKKSRVFMASGAFLLAICAILATKANKRFALQLSTVSGDGGSVYYLYNSALAKFATVSAVSSFLPAIMTIYTANGGGSINAGQLEKPGTSTPVNISNTFAF
jgi:hypothetical protein